MIKFDKKERADLAPELQEFQALFFDMLDAYMRTLYGEGRFEVKIHKLHGGTLSPPVWTKNLGVEIKGANNLLEQFTLAERMALFWGVRMDRLAQTLKDMGG